MRKFKTQRLQIILDDWSTGHEGAGPVESEKGRSSLLSNFLNLNNSSTGLPVALAPVQTNILKTISQNHDQRCPCRKHTLMQSQKISQSGTNRSLWHTLPLNLENCSPEVLSLLWFFKYSTLGLYLFILHKKHLCDRNFKNTLSSYAHQEIFLVVFVTPKHEV